MNQSTWTKFRALTGSERRLFLLALILQPVLVLALRIWGFKSVHHFLRRTSPPPSPPALQLPIALTPGELRRIAHLVDIAADRVPVRVPCLTRSLTLWWLLRRRGIESDLRIGVRKSNGEFASHAWLECAGMLINDSPHSIQNFMVFAHSFTSIDVKSS